MQTMRALVKKKAEPGLWLDEVPVPSLADPRVLLSDCPTNAPVDLIDEHFPTVKSYPVPPPPQQMPM